MLNTATDKAQQHINHLYFQWVFHMQPLYKASTPETNTRVRMILICQFKEGLVKNDDWNVLVLIIII